MFPLPLKHVFGNRVLRKIFVPEGGSGRRLERTFMTCTPQHIFSTVIKSRMMRWAGHAARMGQLRNVQKYYSENLKGRDHSAD
jgi:hypothetical protein